MTGEELERMLIQREELGIKKNTLIVRGEVYFELQETIDNLHIDYIVDERLPDNVKALLVDGDIFDAIHYLEKGSDVK